MAESPYDKLKYFDFWSYGQKNTNCEMKHES